MRSSVSLECEMAVEISDAVAAVWPTGACWIESFDQASMAAFHAGLNPRSMLQRVEAVYFGKYFSAPCIVANSRSIV
jgi:hypothetical protein